MFLFIAWIDFGGQIWPRQRLSIGVTETKTRIQKFSILKISAMKMKVTVLEKNLLCFPSFPRGGELSVVAKTIWDSLWWGGVRGCHCAWLPHHRAPVETEGFTDDWLCSGEDGFWVVKLFWGNSLQHCYQSYFFNMKISSEGFLSLVNELCYHQKYTLFMLFELTNGAGNQEPCKYNAKFGRV